MSRHLAAILFDIGDTLISEAGEVKNAAGITLRADFWPGMVDAVRQLKTRGYRLGIVADAFVQSAENVLEQEGLRGAFDVMAVSEALGVEKPDPRIFRYALDGLGMEPPNYGRVVYAGNNLARDVAGANGLGLTSVWVRWTDRRRTRVEAPWEAPDFTVRSAAELLALIDRLEEDPSPAQGAPSPPGADPPAKWGSVVPGTTLAAPGDESDLALAARYAPVLIMDRHEPFAPLVAGYTIFRQDGYSPSFPRCIGLSPITRKPAALAIEYAIWWDWDIQHLYELEHVWTYVGADGEVAWAEGSWHGDFLELRSRAGKTPVDGTHPVATCQPGKHALAGNVELLLLLRDYTAAVCGPQAGATGVLVSPIYSEVIRSSPRADDLARRYLRARAFAPAHRLDQEVRITAGHLVPWPVLQRWIPARISWLLGGLSRQ